MPREHDIPRQSLTHNAVSLTQGAASAQIEERCNNSVGKDQAAMDFQVKSNIEDLEMKDIDDKIQCGHCREQTTTDSHTRKILTKLMYLKWIQPNAAVEHVVNFGTSPTCRDAKRHYGE